MCGMHCTSVLFSEWASWTRARQWWHNWVCERARNEVDRFGSPVSPWKRSTHGKLVNQPDFMQWMHECDIKNIFQVTIAIISFSKEETTFLKKARIQTMVLLTVTKHSLKCFYNECEITTAIWHLRANIRMFLLCKIISYLLLNCS